MMTESGSRGELELASLLEHVSTQGRLKIWTEDLEAFFLSWKLVEIWKNDTNTI